MKAAYVIKAIFLCEGRLKESFKKKLDGALLSLRNQCFIFLRRADYPPPPAVPQNLISLGANFTRFDPFWGRLPAQVSKP